MASVEVPYKYGHQLTDIADRIDAEHQKAMAETYGNGVMSVPIALDESAWVELPKDADGEPIHVGDKVTCARSVWQVTGLRLTGLAWGVCCTIFNDHGGSGTNVYPPCDLRHYHEPTVKDVLREVVTLCHNTWKKESAFHFYDVDDVMESDNIAEYAAKLRLAGEK